LRRGVWERHDAAEWPLASQPHDVVAALAKGLRPPADDLGIECNRRLRILSQIFVPNEVPVFRICHGRSPLSRVLREHGFRDWGKYARACASSSPVSRLAMSRRSGRTERNPRWHAVCSRLESWARKKDAFSSSTTARTCVSSFN